MDSSHSSAVEIKVAWTIALVVLFSAAAYSSRTITHGFVSYYAAARLLADGRLGPLVYDDAWFGRYVQDVTQSSVREIFVPNPPSMALMAWPIARLTPMTARTVWLFASLGAFLLASALILRRRTVIPSGTTPGMRVSSFAVVLVVLLNPAVFANLRIGQGYLFVYALFAATVLCLLDKRDGWAGACLGLLLTLKTAGVALFVLLAVRRRFRALVAAVAVAVALAMVMAPWIDSQMWIDYPAHVREYVARPASALTAYQTTLSLFRHLCVADPEWNPAPAANCAPIAYAIPTVLLGLALLVTLGVAVRSHAKNISPPMLAAALCLSELTLPAAAEPHFALLAVPLVMLDLTPTAFLVFASLFLVPLEYTAQRFSAGWGAVLGYPRLYAAWLLWALAIREAVRSLRQPR